MAFKGFLYVKHGAVGTRSEGPQYWLQTSTGAGPGPEYPLRLHERLPFDPPDFELEFYNRKIVEVTGELVEFGEDSYVQVTGLHVMRGANLIPPAGEDN